MTDSKKRAETVDMITNEIFESLNLKKNNIRQKIVGKKTKKKAKDLLQEIIERDGYSDFYYDYIIKILKI